MSKKIPHIIFSIFLGMLNLSLLCVVGWASYRGFELSDESFYYLGYLYFDNTPDLTAASFHLIYGRLFSFLDLGLPEVRLLRLFLTLLASLVLYVGIQQRKGASPWWDRLILFNIVLGGMLLGYAWAPLALSYNSMSSILIAFIVGFWLLSLGTKGWPKMTYWMVLGSLFVLLFFTKATNLILLPLIIMATLYWQYTQGMQKRRSVRSSMPYGLAFTIGIITMLIIISGGITSIQETIDSYLQQLFGLANGDSSHSFSYLWNRYYKNAEMVVQELKFPILGVLFLYVSIKAYTKTKQGKTNAWLSIMFKVLGILIFLAFIIQNEYWKGGTLLKYKILIPYIFAVVFALLNRSIEAKKLNLIILLGLLSVPIAGAIGTNNGLSAQVLFYAVFVFLMIYYMLDSSSSNWFKGFVISTVMLLATSQITSGIVLRPYRVAPLAQNTLRLNKVPTLKNLKVDSTVFELSKNLESLGSFEAEYIFTYSGILGVNTLAGKKPYSLEWFNEGDDEKICTVIKKSKISPDNILFLIPEELPFTTAILSCLANKGIHFNADYAKIKSFKFFYPRRKKTMTLNVYEYSSN